MRFFLLLFHCALALCTHAGAETVEQVVNPRRASSTWVSDMARVLDGSNERKLNALLGRLEARTGAEMAVVTVRRTQDLEPKAFATRLFNRWGIGKRGRDNGVLLLLVVEARRVEVETGNGMGRILPDGRVQAILHEHAVPRFRDDDYGGGVLSCAREMARLIERGGHGQPGAAPYAKGSSGRSGASSASSRPARAPARSVTAQPPRFDTPRADDASEPAGGLSGDGAGNGIGWLPAAGGVLLLPLVGWMVVRSKTRHCPRCRQKMRRLSEVEDDLALSFDQKFEEDLGSVDYRAWKCPACGAATVERAVRWLSGYDDCPRCIHRTVSSQTTILRQPTYTHTGESLITRACRFPGCGFGDQQRRVLPIRQRPAQHHRHGAHRSASHSSSHHSSSSSSSSSGDFGGGSSSGGGAGASW